MCVYGFLKKIISLILKAKNTTYRERERGVGGEEEEENEMWMKFRWMWILSWIVTKVVVRMQERLIQKDHITGAM